MPSIRLAANYIAASQFVPFSGDWAHLQIIYDSDDDPTTPLLEAEVQPNLWPPLTFAGDWKYMMDWHKAKSYAQALTAHGHKDWRIPDRQELNLIFENSAAIGGFNTSGSFPAGWYWSSSGAFFDGARYQKFSDGNQASTTKYNGLSVRCVRG